MEAVLGFQLQPDQRLVILVTQNQSADAPAERPNIMDLVTHFYDGVGEHEIDEIDALIKARADFTRPVP
ncbi:MAG TPA: hypothetical protein VIK18_08285 [Pirellulales bacterium]